MIRVDRAKKLKNSVNFYKNGFAMRPPYMILCDGNFLFAACDLHIDIDQGLTDAFKGQIYLKVPTCVKSELDGFNDRKFRGTQDFVRTKCQRFHCAHRAKSANQCILDTLRRGFIGAVATQDSDVRRLIHRDYSRIPVFFIGDHGLEICPPPKSLRQKVQSDLSAKYGTKNQEDKGVEPGSTVDQKSPDNSN
jgi:rRNA-processing protein FCF1